MGKAKSKARYQGELLVKESLKITKVSKKNQLTAKRARHKEGPEAITQAAISITQAALA